MNEIDELIESCFAFEKAHTVTNRLDDGSFEIISPLVDRHGDCLAVHARISGDEITLDDDGYVLGDLQLCGIDITSYQFKQALNHAVCGFGVDIKDGVILTRTNRSNFPFRKNALIQAMLAAGAFYPGE